VDLEQERRPSVHPATDLKGYGGTLSDNPVDDDLVGHGLGDQLAGFLDAVCGRVGSRQVYGLTNSEANHGEDVKEYYFYLDSTPTHSYMRYLVDRQGSVPERRSLAQPCVSSQPSAAPRHPYLLPELFFLQVFPQHSVDPRLPLGAGGAEEIDDVGIEAQRNQLLSPVSAPCPLPKPTPKNGSSAMPASAPTGRRSTASLSSPSGSMPAATVINATPYCALYAPRKSA
jgi:hypothetical protein